MDPKKRILIVDDEPNVRLVLATALESVGYQVDRGRGRGEGARATDCRCTRASTWSLLDLQMPRMDGMELLARLRDSGSIVPVVILTAHGSIPEAVAAMKLGAIDFLTKPITPEALRRVVAEVIARTCTDLPRTSARARGPKSPIARSRSPSIWRGPSGP